jgi:uncharacterized OB-fold protein
MHSTILSARCKRLIATTATHYKGEAPLNIALIDVDEGFRMMSRVELAKQADLV